jgi:hypothetical protein
MKRLLLSAGLAGLLTAPSPVGALETTVVIVPPSPITGEPLTILVTRGSATEIELLVSVQANPGPPNTGANPGPPTIEIVRRPSH